MQLLQSSGSVFKSGTLQLRKQLHGWRELDQMQIVVSEIVVVGEVEEGEGGEDTWAWEEERFRVGWV